MNKTGMFFCICPSVASAVDMQETAAKIEFSDTVIYSFRYLCSQRGIGFINGCIKKYGLDRIIIVACSRDFHMDVFKKAFCMNELKIDHIDTGKVINEDALVNLIREKLNETKKQAIEDKVIAQEVLVVGGGVAGVQVALDIAEEGYRVYVVESSPSIGGIMAQLDKTFPTMDCSICILGPKLVDASKHPNIELITNAEIKGIKGKPGDFTVEIEVKPRYVDMDKCNGCSACVEVCPVILPNEWDLNLKPRKCIYVMFAQSVPLRYTIDKQKCIECEMCKKVCELDAINLNEEPKTRLLNVGAIVICTGTKTFDAAKKGQYGYGRINNVVTNIEFERIICASGPTSGELLRPDGKQIKRVAFIQCVGSRDIHFHEYCSFYCCMASIKEARLVMEHEEDAEVWVFYNDLRAFGKGFEELYVRSKKEGMKFIRGLPGEVRADTKKGDPVLVFEDPKTGKQREAAFDMVVLAVALEPSYETIRLAKMLDLKTDSYGFIKELHPISRPLQTSNVGIFLAGTCQGPKDIPESVSQASGAAAKVCALFSQMKK
ncbi:MAG: CoB--CoM heterodisulfide reductase iron-sulfur subunit A family protein [Thermodesulfobacteriota bacterium]|nr:CoB--CoM heterodisulfide reductase iron-sulfur subunit A family protein [Thermodesulfobacteriota bacterium]